MGNREPDTVDVAARIAFDAHDRGDLDRDALVDILEQLIDARACTNGYAERYGLPSQQGRRAARRR